MICRSGRPSVLPPIEIEASVNFPPTFSELLHDLRAGAQVRCRRCSQLWFAVRVTVMRIMPPGKSIPERKRAVGGASFDPCQSLFQCHQTVRGRRLLLGALHLSIGLMKVLCDRNVWIAGGEASPERHLLGRRQFVERRIL